MSRIEILLNKAQNIWEKEMTELNGLPDPADVDSSWYKFRYQEFRKILHQRNMLGFANGVFHSLAAFDTDERKKQKQTFNHGDGI